MSMSKFFVKNKRKIIIGLIVVAILAIVGGSLAYYFSTRTDTTDDSTSEQIMSTDTTTDDTLRDEVEKTEEVTAAAISSAADGLGGNGLSADTATTDTNDNSYEPGSAPSGSDLNPTNDPNTPSNSNPPSIPSQTDPAPVPESVKLTNGIRNEAYVSKTESVLLKNGKHICVNGVSYKVYAIYSGVNQDTIYVRPRWYAGFSEVRAKLNDCPGAPWEPPPELPVSTGNTVTVASFNEYHKGHGYVGNFFGVGKGYAAKLRKGDKLCINGVDREVDGFNTGLSLQITYVYVKPNVNGTVKDGDQLKIGGC